MEVHEKNRSVRFRCPFRQRKQMNPLSCYRMSQYQSGAVQREASGKSRIFLSVQKISLNRTSDSAQMHPDLMGSPCSEFQQNQTVLFIFRNHAIIGFGRFSIRADHPFEGCSRCFADRQADLALFLRRMARRPGQIDPAKAVCVQQLLQQML